LIIININHYHYHNHYQYHNHYYHQYHKNDVNTNQVIHLFLNLQMQNKKSFIDDIKKELISKEYLEN